MTMIDITDRHLTIDGATTAVTTALFFHARQAESFGEFGEDTPEDKASELFHRKSVDTLAAALGLLTDPQEAYEVTKRAWERASLAVSGD
jgi:hypothetical protein